LSESGDALEGQVQARLEEYMGAFKGREGGTTGAETLFVGELVIVGMLRVDYNKVRREMRDERLAGSWRKSILG